MAGLEHRERDIREYVLLESEPGTTISHLERVASKRVLGRRHDIWDVHASNGRWWVITDLNNMYSQDRFPSMDQTLTFHLGTMLRIFARQEPSVGEEQTGRISASWRRLGQAAEALDDAEEAEDFQAVGMRCREALLTLVTETTSPDMVPEGQARPPASDFIHWMAYLVRHICQGEHEARLRSYLQSMSGETWRYINWLTHTRNAARSDAELGCRNAQYFYEPCIHGPSEVRAGESRALSHLRLLPAPLDLQQRIEGGRGK